MAAILKALSTKWLLITIVFLGLIRIILMASFPVIGDEAYYFYWGNHFAGGYYDLSPMVGWWEAAFSKVSMHPLWLRMPNLLSLLAVGFGMQEWVRQVSSRERANRILMLFLFSPIPFIAVLISPDVPLMFFSFFSVLLFYQDRPRSYFFSGALWGAALLSKYFAVFLLPAMLIWFLIQKRKSWLGFFAFIAGAIPFAFQHLYWNSTHCWSNVIFNAVTRQGVVDGTRSSILIMFGVYLLILATPALFIDAAKGVIARDAVELGAGFERIEALKRLRQYLLLMWVVPISIFGATALMGKGQGLHWYLSYVPFFMMWVGLGYQSALLRKRSNEMVCVALALSIVAASVSLFPRATLEKIFAHRYTYDFNVVTLTDEYLEKIVPDLEGVDVVFTDGYTQSAVLDYAFQKYASEKNVKMPPVNVWGEGSRFGRAFDWTIDYKTLEGKRIALITRGMPDLARWQQYFFQFKPREYHVGEGSMKANFYITHGDRFEAAAYHRDVVAQAVRTFYPLHRLPFKTEACSLGELQ